MKKEEEAVSTIEFGFKEQVLQFYFLNKTRIHTYMSVFLGFAVLFIAYIASGPGAEDANGAKQAFETWKKNPLDQTLNVKMFKVLKNIVGLERAKESEIAQIFLSAGKVERAYSIGYPCIERLRKEAPFHAAFAETSVAIEKGEFQKALEASVALKGQMEEVHGTLLKEKRLVGGSTLFASNLLRIAFLQKKVGNEPGELAAWEEVKGLLDLQENSSASQLLKANFIKNRFSLDDFISHRERSIVH